MKKKNIMRFAGAWSDMPKEEGEKIKKDILAMRKGTRLNEIKEGLSMEMAAELCKISISDMLTFLKKRNIDWTGYDKKDLERDIILLK
jgi:predicted HTH domain antitoxin